MPDLLLHAGSPEGKGEKGRKQEIGGFELIFFFPLQKETTKTKSSNHNFVTTMQGSIQPNNSCAQHFKCAVTSLYLCSCIKCVVCKFLHSSLRGELMMRQKIANVTEVS